MTTTNNEGTTMFDNTEIEPLTDQELESLMYGDGETPIDNTAELTGEQHAQRAARTIAKLVKRRDREMERIGSEMDRLQAIYLSRGKVYKEAIEHEKRIIEGWHHGNADERTFRTGYGESKLKAATVQVEIEDETKVVKWAESNDLTEVIKVSVEDTKAAVAFAIQKGFEPVKAIDPIKLRQLCPKLVKSKLAKDNTRTAAVTDDGQPIPGVVLARPEPTWVYVTNDGEVIK